MPYFYKIQELATGKYYVGCRYAKNATAADLGVTYFTSCRYVKEKAWSNFTVCYIIERPDARDYEKRYLRKCFNLLGKTQFLRLMINRNIAPGILNTSESIEKANKKRKISNSVAAKRLISEGNHNFQKNRYTPSDEDRRKSSQRMKGNKYGMLRTITEEYKQKAALKSQGNRNVRGKKWWNDGKQRKRSHECPGEDWTPGWKTKEVSGT